MKTKIILFAFFTFISQFVFTQEILIKNDIASIDGKEFIKIVKKNKNEYIIKDIVSDVEILKVKTKKTYNGITKKTTKQPQVLFLELNKNVGFETADIRDEYDLTKFLFEKKLVFLNGDVNTGWVLDFIKKRNEKLNYHYKKVNKNEYRNFEIKPILSVVNNDTIYINKLIFNEVYSEFYIQKVMYDRFGIWDKALKLENKENFILVWENIKLFRAKPDLYTVAADGFTKSGYNFASVIVFDSKSNNCLSEDSDLKNSIITFFSNGIKNLNSKTKFYQVYNKAMLDYKYK